MGPMYMAPETLLTPSDVDGRTDLYALGAVGYFMVTGTHAFESDKVVEALEHHLHTEPTAPSARLGAPVADDLERVLLRCLAKKPEDRFGAGFARAKARAQAREGAEAQREGSRRSSCAVGTEKKSRSLLSLGGRGRRHGREQRVMIIELINEAREATTASPRNPGRRATMG